MKILFLYLFQCIQLTIKIVSNQIYLRTYPSTNTLQKGEVGQSRRSVIIHPVLQQQY